MIVNDIGSKGKNTGCELLRTEINPKNIDKENEQRLAVASAKAHS